MYIIEKKAKFEKTSVAVIYRINQNTTATTTTTMTVATLPMFFTYLGAFFVINEWLAVLVLTNLYFCHI